MEGHAPFWSLTRVLFRLSAFDASRVYRGVSSVSWEPPHSLTCRLPFASSLVCQAVHCVGLTSFISHAHLQGIPFGILMLALQILEIESFLSLVEVIVETEVLKKS